MAHAIRSYVELTKPRILTMILITAAVGFFLGARDNFSWILFLNTLVGTALTCAGSCVLNNYMERDVDLQMRRTCRRCLPSGQVNPSDALVFGIILVLSGTTLLVWRVNLLCGFIALLTAFLYVLVYTPLKRVSWLNTFVGAIPGALPPLGGWAAATNGLDLGGWTLFLILFLWQHPHFYAIAWMYREDYARGGFKMLPVVEPDGASTFRQIIIYSLLLLPISIVPTFIGMSGTIYFMGALTLGFAFLMVGMLLHNSHSVNDARNLLRASVIYLPLLLILIVCDRGV